MEDIDQRQLHDLGPHATERGDDETGGYRCGTIYEPPGIADDEPGDRSRCWTRTTDPDEVKGIHFHARHLI